MANDRLIGLETALAHQEQQIADLHETVNRQWSDIERMRLDIDKLLGRLETVESNAGGDEMSGAAFAAANKAAALLMGAVASWF